MELEIIAHRGFSAKSPENTLAAFSLAIERGADSIEFDIQLAAGGLPVVIHDPTLNRTTGTWGKVAQKTLEQIKALDAGSWFSPEFAGERIPTLKETLLAVKGIPKYIYLDVKKHCDWTMEQVQVLLEMLTEEGWQDRCIVSSFSDKFVRQLLDLSSDFTIGYIVGNSKDYKTQLAKATNAKKAAIISQYRVFLKEPSLVESARSQGIDVVAWTVDSPQDFQRLTDIGVKRIITNCLID